MSKGTQTETKVSEAAWEGQGFSGVQALALSEKGQLVVRLSDILREAGNPDFYVEYDFLFKFYQ